MSFIEKKKGLLTLKVLYLYKPCINYLFSIQGTRCILKVDSKKNKKNYFPCVFYTTPFKWWVILPVLNSFRKKNEIGNIICCQ